MFYAASAPFLFSGLRSLYTHLIFQGQQRVPDLAFIRQQERLFSFRHLGFFL